MFPGDQLCKSQQDSLKMSKDVDSFSVVLRVRCLPIKDYRPTRTVSRPTGIHIILGYLTLCILSHTNVLYCSHMYPTSGDVPAEFAGNGLLLTQPLPMLYTMDIHPVLTTQLC
jgi:hypothetical protein